MLLGTVERRRPPRCRRRPAHCLRDRPQHVGDACISESAIAVVGLLPVHRKRDGVREGRQERRRLARDRERTEVTAGDRSGQRGGQGQNAGGLRRLLKGPAARPRQQLPADPPTARPGQETSGWSAAPVTFRQVRSALCHGLPGGDKGAVAAEWVHVCGWRRTVAHAMVVAAGALLELEDERNDLTEGGVRVQVIDGDPDRLAVLARLYAQLESGARLVADRYAMGIGMHRTGRASIWKQYVDRRPCHLTR